MNGLEGDRQRSREKSSKHSRAQVKRGREEARDADHSIGAQQKSIQLNVHNVILCTLKKGG